MNEGFTNWYLSTGKQQSSASTHASWLRRIELAYGDLDRAFDEDEFELIFSELDYSSQDEREGKPDPSKLGLTSFVNRDLAQARSVLKRYRDFRHSVTPQQANELGETIYRSPETDQGQQFSLEKDLQRVLRDNIAQLEEGLQVIDGGTERTVPSGRIDILARDVAGREVVIELKAVQAQDKVLAQIAAYMGDRIGDGAAEVRGIIVAPDFHPKLLSACRVAPSIQLVKYSFQFQFDRLES